MSEFIYNREDELKARVKELERELEKAEDVISYYADPESYDFDSSSLDDDDELISYEDVGKTWVIGRNTKYPYEDFCGGKRARNYFKEKEGER